MDKSPVESWERGTSDELGFEESAFVEDASPNRDSASLSEIYVSEKITSNYLGMSKAPRAQ